MKWSPHQSSERGNIKARTPPNLFPTLKSNRTAARNNLKNEQHIPLLFKSQKQNSIVERSRGGGRFTKCNSSGAKPDPQRHAASQQPEVPAGTNIAERGHRIVPDLGGAPEDEPAGDPKKQALVPSVRPTQGGKR